MAEGIIEKRFRCEHDGINRCLKFLGFATGTQLLPKSGNLRIIAAIR